MGVVRRGHPPRGMMHPLGGNPGSVEVDLAMRRFKVPISAALLLAGLLLATRDLEHVTPGRVVVAAVLVLGGMAAFGLTLREN